MNLNTWQEATALGFPECERLATGMCLMGSLKVIVVYKQYWLLCDDKLRQGKMVPLVCDIRLSCLQLSCQFQTSKSMWAPTNPSAFYLPPP